MYSVWADTWLRQDTQGPTLQHALPFGWEERKGDPVEEADLVTFGQDPTTWFLEMSILHLLWVLLPSWYWLGFDLGK